MRRSDTATLCAWNPAGATTMEVPAAEADRREAELVSWGYIVWRMGDVQVPRAVARFRLG